MSDPRTLHVSDPSALRAMAHPLRQRIIGALRTDGPQTIGALSERLEAAPGSVSYHMGTLARHGFVEEAPELARDGRERWWRATAELTSFRPAELVQDPAQRAAAEQMRRSFVQLYAAEQLEYLAREPELEAEWVAAATMGDDIAWLTPAELRELSDELEALAARWHSRGERQRPDATPVRLLYSAFRRP